MEVEAFQKLDPQTFYRKFLSEGVRPDGRGLQEVRDVAVSCGVLTAPHVAASALVTLGDTKVVTGITLQVGQPSQAEPGCGDVEVSVHLTPLCSSMFSVGRPSEQAQALEALIRDVLTASRPFRREDLLIEARRFAWRLCIDMYCLSYEGNAADAALLSVAACLLRLRLPPTVITPDGEVLVAEGEGTPLPVSHVPLPLTFGVFEGALVADPSLLEEDLVAAALTVVQSLDEGKGGSGGGGAARVCAVHKAGGACVAPALLARALALGRSHAQRVLPVLRGAAASAAAAAAATAPGT
ncbi:ribosomal protein S5 domain 2-type protein [Tribonema minus]|uniref:Ribosomal RNA-processing protein 43 n=1 Tax=Tribonema minus TaxID=303371 RepID=A0A836C8N5_9STRA|nr:ribosomal protein S5 domain 2-type protein [Tribonema minus]